MRTTKRNVWHGSVGIALSAIACAFALACAFVAPAASYAADVEQVDDIDDAVGSPAGLTVGQTFKTTGKVPAGVTGSFDYELTAVGGAPLPGGESGMYSFTLKGDGDSKTFPVTFDSASGADAFAFDHAGVFEYDVVCTSPGDDKMAVDKDKYHASIEVVNAAGGALVLKQIVVKNSATGEKPDGIIFNHVYSGPSKSIVVHDPPVKKSIEGGVPASNATFRFLFKADEASYPMPEGSSNGQKTVQVVGTGEVEIGQIEFAEPGVYGYTVAEIDDGAAGYTYDKSMYKVTFTVTETEGNGLDAARTITKNGEEVQGIEAFDFVNQYQGKQANPVQRAMNKIMPKTGDSTWMLTAISAVLCISVATAIVAYAAIKRRRRAADASSHADLN